MSEMLELAKRIAERAGKNAKVAPELLYAPILWELQDDARRSADSAHAKIANWLEDQARIATNGLHCGDNSTVIKHTYDWADKLEAAARHLRAEPRASAVSAQPEVWMWRATVGGVWGSWRLLDQPIDEFKKSAWGFNLGNGTAEVRALYARPERTEPQTAPSDIERAFQDACDEAGCAYNNEALLEAIHALKERCQAESDGDKS